MSDIDLDKLEQRIDERMVLHDAMGPEEAHWLIERARAADRLEAELKALREQVEASRVAAYEHTEMCHHAEDECDACIIGFALLAAPGAVKMTRLNLATGPVLHAFGGLELTPLELCRRLDLDESRCGEVDSALMRLVLAGFVEVTAHGTYRPTGRRPWLTST